MKSLDERSGLPGVPLSVMPRYLPLLLTLCGD
jgi:hypothetical protein